MEGQSDQRTPSAGLGEPRPIRVLRYHRICKDGNGQTGLKGTVTAKRFRRQLEFLSAWGFTPITFEDYRLYLRGELNLPRKPVILTFDDAVAETYQVAYPALLDYGMKAVVFTIADPRVMSGGWTSCWGEQAPGLMSEQQIVEMHEAGFEIGSHGLTHANLTRTTKEESWEEIARSRMLLEIKLNAPIHTFAYPYGLFTPETKSMIGNAGYTAACATDSGPTRFGKDLWEVRRVTISDEMGLIGFALRLLTPLWLHKWWFR